MRLTEIRANQSSAVGNKTALKQDTTAVGQNSDELEDGDIPEICAERNRT